MTKSVVIDSDTGEGMDSTVRTSTGAAFYRAETALVADVERRIAQVGASIPIAAKHSNMWSEVHLQSMHSSTSVSKRQTNQTSLVKSCALHYQLVVSKKSK